MVLLALTGSAPAALIAPAPVRAQAIPGGHPRDHANRHLQRRMEYRAEILGELNELLSEWRDAWVADRPAELAELYTEDAVVSPPDGTAMARGRAAVEEFLETLLPTAGGIETNLADFDVGDGLAYAMGQFSFPVAREGGRPLRLEGKFVTVFRQDGRRWRIRSQLFEVAS